MIHRRPLYIVACKSRNSDRYQRLFIISFPREQQKQYLSIQTWAGQIRPGVFTSYSHTSIAALANYDSHECNGRTFPRLGQITEY